MSNIKKLIILIVVLAIAGGGVGIYIYMNLDRTPPTITVLNPEVNYESMVSFSELATVVDDSGKDVTISVENDDVRSGILIDYSEKVIIFDKIGTYELKITASDSRDNKSEATVTVQVKDKTAPEITDHTENFETSYGEKLSYSMKKNDKGFYVIAEDKTDVTLSVSDIQNSKGESVPRNYYGLNSTHIIFNVPGSYSLIFAVTDTEGNVTNCTTEVEVTDDSAPVFQNLEDSYTIGEDKTEVADFANVKAIDKIDGDLTDSMKINTKNVKFGVPGTYTAKFTVTDKSGNKATKKVKIYIVDVTKPVITLSKESITLKQGSKAPDYTKYVTAKDAIDGNLKSSVTIDDSKVNYNKAGTYQVVVSVSDYSGNTSSEIIQVIIQAAANTKTTTATKKN